MSWSDTQIVATVPSGASAGPVTASVNGVTSNQNVLFTMPKPTLTGLVPASGPGGTQFQINGSGFGAAQGSSTVTFHGLSAAVVSWSDTQIVATVPSTASTGQVVVTEGGVLSTPTMYFEVPAPQITSISPTSGVVGTQVTINGSGFESTQGGSSYVTFFNGNTATIVSWSATQIVATVPSGASTGRVKVVVNGISDGQYFIFTTPNPIISGLSPASGSAGAQVQINGSGFGAAQGSSTVTFHGVSATVVSWSGTQIVVTVPATASTGLVQVSVGGVVNTPNMYFSVLPPRIDSLSPTSAGAGNAVTITGGYFQTS